MGGIEFVTETKPHFHADRATALPGWVFGIELTTETQPHFHFDRALALPGWVCGWNRTHDRNATMVSR